MFNPFKKNDPMANNQNYGEKHMTESGVRNTSKILEMRDYPRYDIDGRRYGNTFQDDMFAIKNPPTRGNRHAPGTLDYFNLEYQLKPEDYIHEEPSILDNISAGARAYINRLKDLGAYMTREEGYRPLSRKKKVTEGGSGIEKTEPLSEILWDTVEAEEARARKAEYERAVRERVAKDARKRGGGTLLDDMLYQKSGGRTEHEKGTQGVTYESTFSPEYNHFINWEYASPAIMELQLSDPNFDIDAWEDEEYKEKLRMYKAYMDWRDSQ